MAIVQNPLINRASGSVGNSVFSKWKKLNTLKAKSITPYPPPTPKQIINRNVFAKAQFYVKQISQSRHFMYLSPSAKISYINYLTRIFASKIDPSTLLFDVSNLENFLITSGGLPRVPYATFEFAHDTFLVRASYYDIFPCDYKQLSGCLFIYRQETDTWFFFDPSYFLGAFASVDFPISTSPVYTSHVFYVTTSLVHKQTANSIYIGTVSY